jgi:hypothetical protein
LPKIAFFGVIWTLAGFSKILNNNGALKLKKTDIYSKGPILSHKAKIYLRVYI